MLVQVRQNEVLLEGLRPLLLLECQVCVHKGAWVLVCRLIRGLRIYSNRGFATAGIWANSGS